MKSEHLSSVSNLYRSECKFILYFPTMYGYCVYPTLSKSPQQLPNFLKITETSIVLIVSDGVICGVSAYTLPFLSIALQNQVPEMILTPFIIPPQTKFGRYIGITLSVRPSMYLVSATSPKRLIGFWWNFTHL